MSVEDILSEMRQDSARKGPACGIALLYKRLSKEERDAFDAALSDEAIQSGAISRWLNGRGYEAKAHTMARHRRRNCGCKQ
jgi:hypothetical protein